MKLLTLTLLPVACAGFALQLAPSASRIVPTMPRTIKDAYATQPTSTSAHHMGGAQIPISLDDVPKLRQVLTTPSFSFGGAAYAAALVTTCNSEFLSPNWILSVGGLAISSVSFASSFLPLSNDAMQLEENEDYPMILGAHIFSASALPLLSVMLWNVVKSQPLLLASTTLVGIGNIAEIFAHSYDGWVYRPDGHAVGGVENVIFSTCLIGGIGLLAASMLASSFGSIVLALSPAILVGSLPFFMDWTKNKGLVYGSQGKTAGVATAVFCTQLHSFWPLLFLIQSYNIIRNAKLILKTDIQPLHVCPSAYAWFSYVVPFGLALSNEAASSSLPLVLGISLLTVLLSDRLETEIVKQYS